MPLKNQMQMLILYFFATLWQGYALPPGQKPNAWRSPSPAEVQAQALLVSADTLSFYARYDSSNALLHRAQGLYEKRIALDGAPQLKENLIRCWLRLGENYRIKSDVGTAKTYLGKGLDSCTVWLGAGHPLTAAAYNQFAQIYETTGDTPQMVYYAEKGLALCKKLYGDAGAELAASLETMGVAEYYRAQYEAAERYFRHSLEIRSRLTRQRNAEMAKSYLRLSEISYANEDFSAGFDYGQQALSLALKSLGRAHPFTAECYIKIGNSYMPNSDHDKARAHFEIAHDILTGLFGEYHYRTIATYTNIAMTFSYQKNFAQAIAFHHKARPVIGKLYGKNAWYASHCTYLGKVYSDQGDYDNALIWYQQSLEAQKNLGIPLIASLRNVLTLMADVHFQQRQYDLCIDHAQQAIASYQPVPRLDARLTPEEGAWPIDYQFAQAMFWRAQAFRERARARPNPQKELETSLASFAIAANVFDRLRLRFEIDSNASQFILSGTAAPFLGKAVQAALAMHASSGEKRYQEMAFDFAQKGKAAALTRNFQETKAKQFSRIPAQVLQTEADLSRQIAQTNTELERMRQRGVTFDDAAYIKVQSRSFTLLQERSTLLKKLEVEYPAYYDLKYQTSDVSIAGLQSTLDEQTAILEYFATADDLYLFTITRDHYTVAQQPLSAVNAEMIDAFRSAIRSDRRHQIAETGRTLFRHLLLPVWPEIKNKSRLLIFPFASLYAIPFEALAIDTAQDEKTGAARRGEPEYLIKHFDISYHYSAGIYLHSGGGRREMAPAPRNAFVAFAPFAGKGRFAIPEKKLFKEYLNSAGEYLSWITRDGEHYCELPWSGDEVGQITAAFKAHDIRGREYIGKQASEENFKKALESARYIHLATHGFVNEKTPALSGIAFSGHKAGHGDETDDGILYAGEIYGLKLDAELVVLSSCESGIGKLVAGEGMIALTRGFLFAGARNIIYSLWKVDDRSTSALMVDFYRQTLAGKSYPAALCAAKRNLLNCAETAAPALWSGFVLMGH